MNPVWDEIGKHWHFNCLFCHLPIFSSAQPIYLCNFQFILPWNSSPINCGPFHPQKSSLPWRTGKVVTTSQDLVSFQFVWEWPFAVDIYQLWARIVCCCGWHLPTQWIYRELITSSDPSRTNSDTPACSPRQCRNILAASSTWGWDQASHLTL